MEVKEKLQSEGFRKYFGSASWLLGERVFSMGVAFAVGTVTANMLGTENFGKFNYAKSFATMITVFAPLGMSGILARNLINDPDKEDLILGTSFVARLIASVFCILLVCAISLGMNDISWNDEVKFWMVIIASVPAFFESFNVLGEYFIAHTRSKFHAYGEFAKTIVSSGIKLLMLLVFKSPVIWFAVVLIVDAIIYDLVVVSVYTKFFKKSIWDWKASFKYAKVLIGQSFPLILAGFVVMLYMKIDQIMISPMLGDKAVGLYAAALRISEATYFVPTVICNALFPALLNARKQSIDLFNKRTQKLSDLMVLIGLCIAVPVTLFSWLIIQLYDKQYAAAEPVLVIHIWSGIMVGIGTAGSCWLTANNLQRYTLYRTALGAVVNIVLNFFFIPWLGIAGSALATLAAQLVASYLSNGLTADTRQLFYMQTKSLFGFGFLSPIKDFLGKKALDI